MFEINNKYLIIAAHPDDEVLAMGGTIARAKALDIKITVKFLGEGISARFRKEEFHSEDYNIASSIRNESAKKSLDFLGVDNVIFGENYCCRFDALDILDLVKQIELIIQQEKPTHIFTHNPIEVNIDHRIVYRAVETAVRPSYKDNLKYVYSFEIPCSGNWTFDNQFKPTTYVDIENFWKTKIKAWDFYIGEERPFPFPRSHDGLKTIAMHRGLQSGLKMAEGFRLLRNII